MIKRGILVYHQMEQEWKVWVGQTSYWTTQGQSFELRITNRYFQAYLEKDENWFVTLENDVCFTLHVYEVYKVRIRLEEFESTLAPF